MHAIFLWIILFSIKYYIYHIVVNHHNLILFISYSYIIWLTLHNILFIFFI